MMTRLFSRYETARAGGAANNFDRDTGVLSPETVGVPATMSMVPPREPSASCCPAFKKGPLWASPESIGTGIIKAIDHRRDTVYLPKFWMFIMAIIRNISEWKFKKMRI
jgi:hypothetical protein